MVEGLVGRGMCMLLLLAPAQGMRGGHLTAAAGEGMSVARVVVGVHRRCWMRGRTTTEEEDRLLLQDAVETTAAIISKEAIVLKITTTVVARPTITTLQGRAAGQIRRLCDVARLHQ